MSEIQYQVAKTVKEAAKMMQAAKGKGYVLAGGTDLLVQMKSGMRAPGVIVDVKKIPEMTTVVEKKGSFTIGAATIDPKTYQVRRGKSIEELTAKELKLLQLFRAHPGEVMSRDHLLNEVWGYHYYGTTRTLDQVIVQLRKKLGDNGGEPKHLLTVHGVGYKLVA